MTDDLDTAVIDRPMPPGDGWWAVPVTRLVGELRRRVFEVVVTPDGTVIRAARRVGHLPGALVAAVRGRREEVLAHVAARAGDEGLRCDVCESTWYCSEPEVRSLVTSPAYCDRPAERPQRWNEPATTAATCPWKTERGACR